MTNHLTNTTKLFLIGLMLLANAMASEEASCLSDDVMQKAFSQMQSLAAVRFCTTPTLTVEFVDEAARMVVAERPAMTTP